MFKTYLSENNFSKFNPKAILFDMDGVLFDSLPNHSLAWVKAMSEHQLPMAIEDVYLNEGQPAADTIGDIYKKIHGKEISKERCQEIYQLKAKYFEELEEVEPMPLALEFCKLLKTKGYELFVVTGSAQITLLESIQKHFPDIFHKSNVISALDVKRGKPHPDPYLEALRRANLQAWEAIVVENAPLGVQASVAAQIFTIAVNTGPLDSTLLKNSGANLLFESIEALYHQWEDIETEISNKN